MILNVVRDTLFTKQDICEQFGLLISGSRQAIHSKRRNSIDLFLPGLKTQGHRVQEGVVPEELSGHEAMFVPETSTCVARWRD